MPVYTVKVKWGKETFKDVHVDTDGDILDFKTQLYSLSCVPIERQKIMCGGKTLKDNEWNIPLKNGAVILLLGTCEELAPEPVLKTKFIEDMSENELAQAIELPAGLANLGNTCYLNSVVQCLKSVKELRESLKSFRHETGFDGPQAMTLAIKSVFDQMDNSASVTPVSLVQTLHNVFPQFAQTGEKGVYRQQDANECWVELMKMLMKLQPRPGNNSAQYASLVEQYFGGTFDCEMKCLEAEDEEVKKSKENFLQLSCFISSEVKYMHSGLKLRLNEQITKKSPTLDRDANYTKQSLISRLPAYLTINFVRFQYKGKEGINAKVLKDIKFPIEFDAFDLCTKDLQEKLIPMRNKFKEVEDAALAAKETVKFKGDKPVEKKTQALPYSFENDLGSNNSGFYTLQAVLTHQGRSSSSGHYVGWVRHKGDQWMKFDDDVVSSVTSEEILRLSGGGDWHVAYVLLYGPKILEEPIEESADAEVQAETQMAVD